LPTWSTTIHGNVFGGQCGESEVVWAVNVRWRFRENLSSVEDLVISPETKLLKDTILEKKTTETHRGVRVAYRIGKKKTTNHQCLSGT
jgi:hypothetical protein